MHSSNPIDYPNRLEAFRERMEEQGLDLAILFDRDDIRYFTGFRLNKVVSSILAVSLQEGPTYLVAQLDLKRAERECWIERVVPFPEDTPNYLTALLPLFREGPRRIGVEKDAITFTQARYIQELGGAEVELVNVREMIAALRLIKSEEEIALIRRAAEIADRAMEAVLEKAGPGIAEADLAAFAEYQMIKEGVEGASFEPFLMSGENGWLPQRIASRKPLHPGELALLDMGGIYEGYCSDLTRTFKVGEISKEQRRIFQIARKAQQEAIEAIRPGVRACDVDGAARRVIEAEGLGEYFPHLTGHGVGVSTHEAPILDRGVETVLQAGMVVTVEPGIYLPEVGAARIEDMVLITPTGHEILTHARWELV